LPEPAEVSDIEFRSFGPENYVTNPNNDLVAGEFKYILSHGDVLRSIAGCSNSSTVAPTSTTSGGGHCWCRATSWTPNGGSTIQLSAQWVYADNINGSPVLCSDNCMIACTEIFASDPSSLLSNATSPAQCVVNTIQITWADAAQSDIDANEAGQCTYGGDIRTPKKAVHKPGKIFTGWIFNAQ